MTSANFIALLPILVVSAAIILVMLASAFPTTRRWAPTVTLSGLLAATVTIPLARTQSPSVVTPLLVIDDHAIFFQGVLLISAIGLTTLARDYAASLRARRGELYLLALLAVLGALVLVASSHFASLFIAIELLSVPLYGMIAYVTHRRACLEASMKYLVLASTSVAFLAFGIALAYASSGSMSLDVLGGSFPTTILYPRLFLAGGALVLVGLSFKLAAVPFHMWIADVYEGAPAPVTAFLATVSKGAILAFLSRYVRASAVMHGRFALTALTFLAVASMIVGNLLAIRQTNVKRLLAYSSVAHVGYALVGICAGSALGYEAVSVYIVAYMATALLAFGTVSACSSPDEEADHIEHYRALFWESPGLAVGFTLALLSLAGIPLTAGFVGKFYLVAAGAASATWGLLFVLIITSAMSLVYYLRIVFAIFQQAPSPAGETSPAASARWRPSRLTLAACMVVLLWLGIGPSPLLTIVRSTLSGSTSTVQLVR